MFLSSSFLLQDSSHSILPGSVQGDPSGQSHSRNTDVAKVNQVITRAFNEDTIIECGADALKGEVRKNRILICRLF